MHADNGLTNRDSQESNRNDEREPNGNCRIEKHRNRNKNSPYGLNGRFEMSKERIGELGDKPVEMAQAKEPREKLLKNSDHSLGVLTDTMNCTDTPGR